MYSVGKPVIAQAVAVLVERGLIAMDEPMARHWPSFTTDTTYGGAFPHVRAAGVPGDPTGRGVGGLDLLCAACAARRRSGRRARSRPSTPSPTDTCWVNSYAGLTGPPAQFVAEEIAAPLGLDFGFGLGPAAIARCADLEYDAPDWPVRNIGEPESVRARAVANPAGARDLAVVNSELWRSASIPAVNLHATAVSSRASISSPGRQAARSALRSSRLDLFIGTTSVGSGVQLEPDGSWEWVEWRQSRVADPRGGGDRVCDPAVGRSCLDRSRPVGGGDS